MPKFNSNEYMILKTLKEEGYQYICRNSNNCLCAFKYLPLLDLETGCWDGKDRTELYSQDFKFIEKTEGKVIEKLFVEYSRRIHLSGMSNSFRKELTEREETEVKNLEAIRTEIWEEMLRLEPNRKDRWTDVRYRTLREILQKLGHLDEPEITEEQAWNKIAQSYPMRAEHVKESFFQLQRDISRMGDGLEALSQEWIGENLEYVHFPKTNGEGYSSATAVIRLGKLTDLLVPKQSGKFIPIISKKAADLIKYFKFKCESTYSDFAEYMTNEDNGMFDYYVDREEDIMHAWITDDYSVEEEQKYTLQVNGKYLRTIQIEVDHTDSSIDIDARYSDETGARHFTEEEKSYIGKYLSVESKEVNE